jgi:hypothetical protein
VSSAPPAEARLIMTVLLENAATWRHGSGLKTLFITLVYLDLAVTLLAVGQGFYEMNPVMAYLLERPGALLAAKVAAPPLIAWLAPSRLLWPSVLVMAGVLTWNALQLAASL